MMIDINNEIKDLVYYAINNGLIDERDRIFCINRILEILELNTYHEPKGLTDSNKSLEDILENFKTWATLNNRIENDTIDILDLFDTKIMSQLIKSPSEIEREFKNYYKISPKEATDYYYNFAKNSNYIRKKRISKDIKWKYDSPYGVLDLTINLSKPEKDPKAISKAKEIKTVDYPKCLLCKENEGYSGRINHPARGNHRVISLNLTNEEWFLQYSPYVYYNEHAIVFKGIHKPMKINKHTFMRLLEFVNLFPHYFIGSNADLPIVGGSILNHDHFQGGNYSFAMANAIEENKVILRSGIEACTLKWPMSVIRLKGKEIDSLVDVAYEIFIKWKSYDDMEVDILSKSVDNEHNTITPIARFRDELFELDFVLRNNRTTTDKPFGIFHPKVEYHHIKKENIGLIEVMGLAVLPSRLKKEIELLKVYLLNKDLVGVENHNELHIHYDWAQSILFNYKLTDDNIAEILELEIGKVFLNVLEDCGVFKYTKIGQDAFRRCRELMFKDLK